MLFHRNFGSEMRFGYHLAHVESVTGTLFTNLYRARSAVEGVEDLLLFGGLDDWPPRRDREINEVTPIIYDYFHFTAGCGVLNGIIDECMRYDGNSLRIRRYVVSAFADLLYPKFLLLCEAAIDV